MRLLDIRTPEVRLKQVLWEFIIILIATVFLSFIFLISLWGRYPILYHTVFELISIFIAFSIFLLIWHSFENNYILNKIIGFGFLMVAIFDVAHTYHFQGLRFYPNGYTDLSTRYWIIGRFFEAIVFYVITLRPQNIKISKWVLFLCTTIFAISFAYFVFFFPGLTPPLLSKQGYTLYARIFELVVILIFIITLLKLKDILNYKINFIFKHIFLAVLLALIAESILIIRQPPTPFVNTLVHVLKIFYYYYLFKGLFISSIVYPYDQLEEAKNGLTRLDRFNIIGEMASSLSHEIRNPLTTVRGFLQLMDQKEENHQRKEHYELMISELDRANALISEFLSLGNDKLIRIEKKNLNDIIESILPLIDTDALRYGIKIIFNKGSICDLLIDEKEIRQLIFNLIRNSIDSMSEGETLTIQTDCDGQVIILTVIDQGSGIKPELYEKIGTPFFTTKDDGTGLGLAVCYRIANRHNAEINFKSDSNGTQFFVRFRITN